MSGKAGNLEMSGNFKMVREKSVKMLKIHSSQRKVREFFWSGKNIKITFFQNTVQQIDALAAVVASLRMQDNAPFSI